MGVSKPALEQVKDIQASQRSGDIARLAKGAGISASGKMVGRGLNFLGQVILARILGPEAFGLYAIGWTILRIISIIGPLGLDSGVIRFGSKYWRDDQEKFRRVFFLSTSIAFISGLLIGGGLFLGATFLSIQFFHKPELEYVLRGFAIAVPIVTTLRVVASATSVSQRLKYATYSEEVSQPASELVFVIAFLYIFGLRIEGAVFAGVLSFGVALTLAIYYMVHLFPGLFSRNNPALPSPRMPFHLELIQFSIPTAFAALFGSSISWVDRLLVGLFRSEAETGIYTTISLVSIIFAIILSGIKVIFSPMIADLYNIGETNRVEEIYRISTKWGLYIGIPLFLVILFGSRELLALSFGAEYIGGSLPLIFLALSQLINIGTGPLDILLIMTGRQKSWMAISGIMLGANILINSILIPSLGLIGAAIGTASTVSGIFIIGLVKVKRDLNIWPYDQRCLKVLISVVVTSAVLFGMTYVNIPSPVVRISSVLVIALVVFGAGLLLQGLDSEDTELISLLKKRIPHKVIGKINR
jgi:O-antigen/teichoic acid export membrane protein